jgi:hypothetical protein
MSRLFKTLSVLAVLVSGAAFASERCNHPATPVTVAVAPPPPAQSIAAGHYEVRQVRTFIPGHWTFIRRGHRMVKTFNPSHYEMVGERVWVNDYQRYTQVAPPPPVQNQGGVPFGLSYNG